MFSPSFFLALLDFARSKPDIHVDIFNCSSEVRTLIVNNSSEKPKSLLEIAKEYNITASPAANAANGKRWE